MPYNPVTIQDLNPMFLGSEDSYVFASANPFIVPTYQRSYKWSTDDFEQLLYDLNRLNVTEDFEGEAQTKAHFMGNLFFYTKIEPTGHTSYHIVDGQQRLTTCVIFLSIIFFELQEVLAYPDLQIEEVFRQKYEARRNKFRTLIVKPNEQGVYYSRFDAGHIELPLACFINYITAGQNDFNNPCEFEPVEESDLQKKFLDSVKLAHEALVDSVEKPAQENLNNATATAYSRRLLKLAVRIMDGLQFGGVTTTNAEDAYRVFVNLNSTGQPLTHFEIFCSRIDQRINLTGTLDQAERFRGYLQNIQSELSPPGKKTTIEEENKLWDAVVGYWQVYDQPEPLWAGVDIAGLLADKICQNNTNGQQIDEILRGLLHIIRLLNRPQEAVKEDSVHQEQRLCLELIKENWPRGIHLVLPFYLNPQVTSVGYTRPLKKIAAFWMLYRMVQQNRGTKKIQDAYKEPRLRHENADAARNMAMREMTLESLEEGLKKLLSTCSPSVKRFANPALFTPNHPDNQVVMSVWSQTAGNISCTTNVVNRILLMFAYHNTIPVPVYPADGYQPDVSLVAANEHVCNRLTYPFYEHFVVKGELEHVYPENPRIEEPWENVTQNLLHFIGNMHLSPDETNNYLTNNGPKQKKFLYEYFAAQLPGERPRILGRMRHARVLEDNENIDVEVHVDHTIFGFVFNFHGLAPDTNWNPDDPIGQPVWTNEAIMNRSMAVCRRAVENLFVWLNN